MLCCSWGRHWGVTPGGALLRARWVIYKGRLLFLALLSSPRPRCLALSLAAQIAAYVKKFHPKTMVMVSGISTKEGKSRAEHTNTSLSPLHARSLCSPRTRATASASGPCASPVLTLR